MNILVFNWRDIKHPQAGGAEINIHNLAKNWVLKGHKVTLFCGAYPNCVKNDNEDGIEIIRSGNRYTVYISAFINYLLRFSGKYDIVIDLENGIPFFTPIFCRKPKVLLIHHIHENVFFKELKFPLNYLAFIIEQKIMPFLYKNTNVMTISESSKEELIKAGLGGKKIGIVYPAIDQTQYKTSNIKSEIPLVVHIGRLKKYKSVDVLLHAFSILAKDVPAARLVIAGTGDYAPELKMLAKKLNIDDKVDFRGFISDEEKINLLQKAWVSANPSYKEGWGITVIEANACGTPVVASNVSGLKDSVIDGKTGFLANYGNADDFANKIKLLLTDRKLRKDFEKNAIAWAKKFDWKTSADVALKFLSDCLQKCK